MSEPAACVPILGGNIPVCLTNFHPGIFGSVAVSTAAKTAVESRRCLNRFLKKKSRRGIRGL